MSQLDHERAVWHVRGDVEKIWQLSPTEGPHRERRRLEQARPKINKKFVRKLDENSPKSKERPPETANLGVPLMQFLREDPAEDSQAWCLKSSGPPKQVGQAGENLEHFSNTGGFCNLFGGYHLFGGYFMFTMKSV